MSFIGKIVCRFKGHKRGKRLRMVTTTDTSGKTRYECPRCGAQWSRKVKA